MKEYVNIRIGSLKNMVLNCISYAYEKNTACEFKMEIWQAQQFANSGVDAIDIIVSLVFDKTALLPLDLSPANQFWLYYCDFIRIIK